MTRVEYVMLEVMNLNFVAEEVNHEANPYQFSCDLHLRWDGAR